MPSPPAWSNWIAFAVSPGLAWTLVATLALALTILAAFYIAQIADRTTEPPTGRFGR
jgi:membrane protein implicated in regulation of membrane protease activity